MLNTIRHKEFFNPINVEKDVHILGVGAVGSHIATFLTRLGIKHIHLWDFDDVEDHNIPNQAYNQHDLGKNKTEALAQHLKDINPEINITIYEKYTNEELSGYVFACVDNIEVRKEVYENNEFNAKIEAVFDTRIALEEGQLISAKWKEENHVENLLNLSDFNHNEVEEETTACGSKLAILPTVILVANLAITNFINFIKTNELKTFLSFNAFNMKISK